MSEDRSSSSETARFRSGESPVFTVALTTYEGARFLLDALDGVARQTFEAWECVIVDDGSTDRSYEIAAEWAAGQDRRIELLTHSTSRNQGVAASRNLAVGEARGGWVAFLDQDDIWHPRKLQRQWDFVRRYPSLVAVGCLPVIRYAEGAPADPTLERWRADIRRLASSRGSGLRFGDFVAGSPFCLSGTVVRRDVLQRVGGFDRSLTHTSDWLTWARIASRWSVGLVDEELVEYRVHGDNAIQNILGDPEDLVDAAAEIHRLLARWVAEDRRLSRATAERVIESLLLPT